MEMSAFMTEHLKDHLKEQRDHDEQVRRGLEAKVEAQRVEMDKLREEAMQAKLEAAERSTVKPKTRHEKMLSYMRDRAKEATENHGTERGIRLGEGETEIIWRGRG